MQSPMKWQGLPPDNTTPHFSLGGWLRIVWRGGAMWGFVFGGFALMLVLRLAEGPLFGRQRPLTPYITKWVCRATIRIIGLPVTVHGRPMKGGGAAVANHTSWLDIFVLNAQNTFYFVAKSEVAQWLVMGALARGTGTVFVKRDRTQAQEQIQIFENSVQARQQLLFFPEGTTTDGLRILPFKPTLFQAFFTEGLRAHTKVQAITVVYHPPKDAPASFYGWWEGMDFGKNLLKILGTRHHGQVVLTYHDPVRVQDFADRKALSQHLEQAIRSVHPCG